MAGIKELPLWARILLGDKTAGSQDRRNFDRESAIAREAAEIPAECHNAFLLEGQPARTPSQQRRWVPCVTTLGSEA